MITNASIWGALRDNADNNNWFVSGAGAPTNGTSGTGAGLTGPGSEYTDITNKIKYINTNTKASPTWTAFGGGGGGNVTLNGTQVLTNKTLGVTNTVTLLDTLFRLEDDGDPTKILAFQLSSITTGTTRTLTVPDADLIIVGTTTTQTLTNKTLTAPTLTAVAITGTSTIGNGMTITTPIINQPITLHPVQVLAGAGTNQGNAGAITLAASGIVYATGANGTVGVVLPVGAVGMRITVANDAAANAVLKVYASATDSATINAVAGSTAYAMAAKVTMDFVFVAAAKWQTLPLLGS